MFCKSGILTFIFAKNNNFVRQYIYTHTLIKTPLLHQSSGPHVFLSLSLSSLSFSLSLPLFFRLIPWSAEALWVHFPARASKTPLRRCSVPSPHREGTWGLWEQSKPCAGALLAFCVNQGISASFSLLLFYHWLQLTRFQSIKGLQQTILPFCISFSRRWSWSLPPVQCHEPPSVHSYLGTLSTRSNPLNLFTTSTVCLIIRDLGFDFNHTWMV